MSRVKRSPDPPSGASNDRDSIILSRLAAIEHKVDSLDQTAAFALRADAAKHADSVRQIFTKSKRRAQVYLAANGELTVQEIAAFLSMKPPNVSSELQTLQREGLLEVADVRGKGVVYAKKAVDRTLRITSILCAQFDLSSIGLDSPKKKSKAKKK